MTIKKLFFALLLTSLTHVIHANFFTRANSSLKFQTARLIGQYNVCKDYDRNVGATTARRYRNIFIGGFALGIGLISSTGYGGYRLIKQYTKTRTK